MEQHKFASVINTESRDSSDMLEAYAAPTVKYKSITIVTTLTIIYTTRVGWINIYMFFKTLLE